jgi:deoxyribodipyrimidine photolyase
LYTVYTPILSGGALNVPKSLSAGWQGVYNLTTNFWASRSLSMMAQIKWNYMMQDITALQQTLETQSHEVVQNVYDTYDATVSAAKSNGIGTLPAEDIASINSIINANTQLPVTQSLHLFHKLLFQYADGFNSQWVGEGATKHFSSSTPGYPGWWLEQVDYPRGPPPV